MRVERLSEDAMHLR